MGKGDNCGVSRPWQARVSVPGLGENSRAFCPRQAVEQWGLINELGASRHPLALRHPPRC